MEFGRCILGKRDGVEHWTCDYQPPLCTYSDKTAKAAGDSSSRNLASPYTVKLYPQCKKCLGKQGRTLGTELRTGGQPARQKAVQSGKDVIGKHAKKPPVSSKTK